MAYQYADWITVEDAVQREASLRNHIAELEADINVDVGSDGKSINHATLEAKLNRLYQQLEKLESINARGGGRTVHFARKR